MIGFVSFFVGLVFGVQTVDLAVEGPVDRIDLVLSGKVIATAEEPPWRFEIDLGRDLRPAVLEAVAYGVGGRELDRDVRWINLPESRADAAIIPSFDDDQRVISARVAWSSPEFDKPERVRVSLDGRELPIRPPYRIDLTNVPQQGPHVLDVEIRFSSELSLRRQLTFGAEFAGMTTSGLTAVPVALGELDELPQPEQLGGWFEAAGVKLHVSAVERERARLVVVRDPGAEAVLLELAEARERQAKRARRRAASRDLDLLDADTEIRVLVPEPVAVEGRRRPTLLFPYSSRGHPGDEGILKAALAPRNDRMLGVGLMLPDAVAMAGLHAAEGNTRRAVLLLLGPEREDVQRFDPESVRAFLRDLRVPLVVWDLSGPARSAPETWPPDRVIDGFDDLARACRRIRYLLAEQRIVWVGGRHLPQAVGLGRDARGISLVE